MEQEKGEFKEPVLVDTIMVVDSRNHRLQFVDKGKLMSNTDIFLYSALPE